MQGWTLSDNTLFTMLRGYLQSLDQWRMWAVDLYTNNFVAGPGNVFTDFVLPTPTQWPGYVGKLIPVSGWSNPQVTADVAQTIQLTTVVFSLPSGVSPVTIYGWLISDTYGNLILAETFATPLVIQSPGGVQIQPRINLGIEPVP